MQISPILALNYTVKAILKAHFSYRKCFTKTKSQFEVGLISIL